MIENSDVSKIKVPWAAGDAMRSTRPDNKLFCLSFFKKLEKELSPQKIKPRDEMLRRTSGTLVGRATPASAMGSRAYASATLPTQNLWQSLTNRTIVSTKKSDATVKVCPPPQIYNHWKQHFHFSFDTVGFMFL